MLRRILKRFFIALLSLAAAFYATAVVRSHPLPDHPFAPDGKVLTIAHRGGLHLGPGHTLPTYTRAVEVGVDVLEIDLCMSKDGVLVAIHDCRVDRTTDGRGAVGDLTLAELKNFDAGYHWSMDGDKTFPARGQGYVIPTLEETLEAFRDQLMVIEIKSDEPSIAADLCTSLRNFHRTDKTIVASFYGDVTDAFRAACPEVSTGATGGEVVTFVLLNLFYLDDAFQASAQAFQMPFRLGPIELVDRRFIEAARNHNVAVHVWTVNDPEKMRDLIAAGIGGIITDEPQSLLELLDQTNL